MLKKILLALLLITLLLIGYAYYAVMVAPVTTRKVVVTIPSGATYEQVLDSLTVAGVKYDPNLITPLAERMAYRRPEMRAGRFALPAGLSHVGLIRRLRGGERMSVDVVLTTEREPMNVAAKAARFLEPDSLAFQTLFQDDAYLESLGLTRQTLQTLFIPNTYRLYWNSTPKQFMERMVKEHARFWDADGRREKAKKLGLTPAEVYTLASIVQSESLARSEQPRIAGLYLNRLDQGIKLQSDPTAVFANREFGLARVLYKHIELDHPYNTYVNYGLPPGPITMPSVSAIDAVLNPEDHDYLYMCAVGDNSGLHNFAKTSLGHAKNIAIYKANLRRRGLR